MIYTNDSDMANSDNYDYLLKIVLVGDSGVGKSSTLLRYADNQYDEKFNSTIGVDFRIKTLQYKNKVVKHQIWDTAGQDRFRSITYSYYRGANIIILCFDTTDYRTFQNIEFWINEVSRYAPDTKLLLVGLKSDLETKKQVADDEVRELCERYDMEYMKASAKTGNGIEQIFSKANDLIIPKFTAPPKQVTPIILPSSPVKKDNCC
jgi:small GTP-binding protein